MINKNITVVCNLIKCLDLMSLKNYNVIANLVRAFGIVCWGPPVFGDDEEFKNTTPEMGGIYQTPDQIGKALVYLSQFKIESYCEIGVFQGGNFIFVSEYLKRFNPNIKCLAIDPTNYLNIEIQNIIDQSDFRKFESRTSNDLAGKKFDLCLIDGDHSLEWITKDWENLGKHAKICMIHDIQEWSCPDVITFWNKLKITNLNTKEFLDHTYTKPLQGIGIIHNQEEVIL